MSEYIKTETLYERDTEGTKQLIEGKFRNKTVEFLKDCQWDFTEKVDGVNVRILWDGHHISFKGRTDNAQLSARLVNYLNDKFCNDETEQLFEQKFGETSIILFGEGYGEKIQTGGNYRKGVSFMLFAVFIVTPNNGIWLRRDAVEDIAKAFNLEIVPIVLQGTLQDGVNFVKSHPKSTMGTAMMEGIVGRPCVEVLDRMGRRVIVKIKWNDFKRLVSA